MENRPPVDAISRHTPSLNLSLYLRNERLQNRVEPFPQIKALPGKLRPLVREQLELFHVKLGVDGA